MGFRGEVLALGDCDCDDLGLRLALEAQVRAGGRRRALELLARASPGLVGFTRKHWTFRRAASVKIALGGSNLTFGPDVSEFALV